MSILNHQTDQLYSLTSSSGEGGVHG